MTLPPDRPGEGGVLGGSPAPLSGFPDYAGGPPRPSVIQVRKVAAGDPRIGT